MKNFWRRAFDFAGRSSRREYRTGILCTVLMGLPGILIALTGAMLHNGRLIFAGVALNTLVGVFWIVPFLALCVRREHDLGQSGWEVLFGGRLGGLDLWSKPSDPAENRYGPPPAGDDPGKH